MNCTLEPISSASVQLTSNSDVNFTLAGCQRALTRLGVTPVLHGSSVPDLSDLRGPEALARLAHERDRLGEDEADRRTQVGRLLLDAALQVEAG